METISAVLDLVNNMCKIAFISYAWITMLRINAYLKKQKSEDKE